MVFQGSCAQPEVTIVHLVGGLSSYCCLDLVRIRFFVLWRRKNSVKDKVIDKKWIYLERKSLLTECGPFQEREAVCRFFNDGHSDWCEVIPHCSFGLHFSNN